MDVESPDKSKRTITHEGLVYEGESTEVTANKEDEQKKVKEVVGKLLTPCVLTLRTSLQEKKYVLNLLIPNSSISYHFKIHVYMFAYRIMQKYGAESF